MKKLFLLVFFQVFLFSFLSAQCKSGDCKNGTGIYIYPSGAKYIGQFKNGEIHGTGACYYTDGKKYQGGWVNRYPEGRGTMTFADGATWTGSWKRGHPIDKFGEIIENLFPGKEVDIEEDNIQSGCLKGNCKNGEGIYAYADGSKYEGQFVNGQIDGNGTFFFVNGDKYIGGFKKGHSHGKGTFFNIDGTKVSGDWDKGEYLGNPVIQSGSEGCIDGDCDNGSGTYVFEGGEAKYVGSFKNEMAHGKGVIYYSNGEKYSGSWAYDSFFGVGTLHTLDGAKVKGWWVKGNYMGLDKPGDFDEILASAGGAPDEDIIEEIVEDHVKELSPSELQAAIREKAGFKVYAVVVGIASYNHMPALRYTKDDAYEMGMFLKSPAGGALPDDQIRLLIDEQATKGNIIRTMKEVFGKAGPNDLVMLYFSGHGLKGSFLPINYDGFNNKLPHDEINKIMAESNAKFKLCIADACHSGSLFAARSASELATLETYYETLGQAEAGTALLMSSKSDETSLESSGLRQGVFSHYLIRGLKGEADSNTNSIVSIQELFNFINKGVREYTGNRQTPIIKGDYDPSMTVAVTLK